MFFVPSEKPHPLRSPPGRRMRGPIPALCGRASRAIGCRLCDRLLIYSRQICGCGCVRIGRQAADRSGAVASGQSAGGRPGERTAGRGLRFRVPALLLLPMSLPALSIHSYAEGVAPEAERRSVVDLLVSATASSETDRVGRALACRWILGR